MALRTEHFAALAALLAACSQAVRPGRDGSASLDAGAPRDATADRPPPIVDALPVDVRVPDVVVRPDVTVPIGGCIDDMTCPRPLTCQDVGTVERTCTAECEDSSSQAAEQRQCGGAGTTCVTAGEMGGGFCTRACRAGSPMTGCRRDQICTGFWYTRGMGTADFPGCAPFCHDDTECRSGQRCNRFGQCAMTVSPTTFSPDGAPCDPSIDPPTPAPSRQCRGVCLRVGTADPRQGLCGSRIDIARPPGTDPSGQPQCPDLDPAVTPLGPGPADNLALCVFRSCPDGCGCAAGLECIDAGAGNRVCTYPQPMGMVVPCARPDAGRD